MSEIEVSEADAAILRLMSAGTPLIEVARQTGITRRDLQRRRRRLREVFGVDTDIEVVVAAVCQELI